MKILTFNAIRLKNAEHLSLSNDVLVITKDYDLVTPNVQNLRTWVEDSNTEL